MYSGEKSCFFRFFLIPLPLPYYKLPSPNTLALPLLSLSFSVAKWKEFPLPWIDHWLTAPPYCMEWLDESPNERWGTQMPLSCTKRTSDFATVTPNCTRCLSLLNYFDRRWVFSQWLDLSLHFIDFCCTFSRSLSRNELQASLRKMACHLGEKGVPDDLTEVRSQLCYFCDRFDVNGEENVSVLDFLH